MLRRAGYRTGLYTSPHLLRFHERMRVNGEEIDDNSLISLTNTVRNAAENMSEMPTGFEIMTAIAFLYFVQEQCDIVSLEVGLGGRMDSTNVIPAPEVCVVANIGLEHTAILGDTVEKIAAEKCGIIKHGSHAVLFGQSEGVENVVCVVTRYFGGILLGAGGLTRAYSKSARDALATAGVAAMGLWTAARCTCPYPLLERVKLEVQAVGGTVDAVDYGAEVALTLSLPEDAPRRLQDQLTELAAGRLRLELSGTELRPGPREDI